MIFDFNELKSVLADWPSKHVCEKSEDGLYQRLSQILSSAQKCGILTQSVDLLPLLRHVMLRQKRRMQINVNLIVPKLSDWPAKNQWQKAGFYCEVLTDNQYKVSPISWSPEWLKVEPETDIFEDIYAEKECCPNLSVPIDPCVRDASGFESYSSEGQKEAIRGAFFAPPGSTLVVNLPTGSGKSLVGYLPSLLGKAEGNFTLFIVPTIALAMDQERQLKNIYKKTKSAHTDTPLAWHGGLSSEDKELVKKSIRNGCQPVLFTSPESVCRSLRWSLYESARKGYLKYFVVDEAHLVSQWGVEFRPDFQALSGIWRGLLEENQGQFKTLLMTATLTEETLDVLKIFFSISACSFQVLSAVHLRPEPRYWHNKAKNFLEKKKQVLEVVRMGVRPLILYETEPKHAKFWHDLLKDEGYQRIACFHGKTGNNRRQKIIDDWGENKLDIIVATSAFGVGMDKGDVRMILHATVPENLDRFYQEVGRGGRDGKASLSLLIYTDKDLDKARGMSYPKVVSESLGQARWSAMVMSQKLLNTEDSIYTIDLSTVPPYLDSQNDYNRTWNMRTLLLMVRAGAVQLCAEPPPKFDDEENNELSESELQAYFDRVLLRYLKGNHCAPEFWATTVSDARVKTATASQRNFDLLHSVLKDAADIKDSLVDLYTIKRDDCLVIVPSSCGGFKKPAVIPITDVIDVFCEDWQNTFPATPVHPVLVTYSREDEKNFLSVLPSLLSSLIKRFGVREIVSSSSDVLLSEKSLSLLYKHAPDRFVLHGVLNENVGDNIGMPIPRVTILYPWGTQPLPEYLQWSTKPFHLIFAPEDIQSDEHSNRQYRDIHNNVLPLTKLIARFAV